LGVRGVEFVEDLDEGGFPIGHEDAEFGANAGVIQAGIFGSSRGEGILVGRDGLDEVEAEVRWFHSGDDGAGEVVPGGCAVRGEVIEGADIEGGSFVEPG
jgi:hypothetical protein